MKNFLFAVVSAAGILAFAKSEPLTLANAGYADDAGEFVVTNESVYAKLNADMKKDVRIKPGAGGWGLKPLGAPGSLKLPTEFVNKPEFRPKAERKPGLVLFDEGVVTTVIAPKGTNKYVGRLADEVAYHLSKMTGKDVKVANHIAKNAKGPFVVIEPTPGERNDHAVVRREGDTVRIAGANAGLSHAVTNFLEALGCRYLWPGPTGKVIPKRTKVILPEIALDWETAFRYRNMRTKGLQGGIDREGNRSFWQWHGLNDGKLRTSEVKDGELGHDWGHYYGDYWKTYHETHPEWFALQPYGSRDLKLGGHTERPTFCLSNPELAKETARRKIEEARKHPEKPAHSICLPDGAAVTWCMCEECRRLDPVNAPAQDLTVFWPERHAVPYVSLTDRVLTFMNRVCEEFAKEFPEKNLCMYAYAGYTQPPVKVKPHRNLVILSVAGGYSNAKGTKNAQANLAAWSSFGNRMLWRPNMNRGFGAAVPQNYGRHAFEDLSAMAVNGIVGCDFDTMYDEWAVKSMGYYFTARAFLNPDGWDYETWIKDYCDAGFGKVAKYIRYYFLQLEKATDAAAEINANDPEPAINWSQRQKRARRILETVDLDKLDRILAKAREEAAGDGEVLARIERLQFGVNMARAVAKDTDGRNKQAQAELRALKAAYLEKDPSAMKVNSEK